MQPVSWRINQAVPLADCLDGEIVPADFGLNGVLSFSATYLKIREIHMVCESHDEVLATLS